MTAITPPTERTDPPKRRLPIQIANEARMIEATIRLLGDHPVDEITSRMIAKESGTATNYISRYFGGRDGLFLAVAVELGHRISDMIRSERSILDVTSSDSYVTRIMSIPDVATWFTVYRYLSSRNLPGNPPQAKPAVVSAIEDSIALIFGLEGEDVAVWANIFLTYLLGNAAFGTVLGTSDRAAEAALEAMGNVVTMLVRERGGRATP